MPQVLAPTLGQKIDAVLEPLYAEAEQYHTTLTEVAQQQAALQAQHDAAIRGLGEIESRMAQVVRAMAQQEPVIAAVIEQGSPEDIVGQPEMVVAPVAEQAPASPVPEPALEVEQASAPPVASAPALSASDPVQAQVPELAAQGNVEAEPEPEAEIPPVELDPQADAQAVHEVAALLDAPLTEAAVQTADQSQPVEPVEPKPEVDLAAAAERAAAAAQKLREKAAGQ